MKQEALFNTDAARNLADSDAARQALFAVASYNDTLKDLGTFLVTFFNLLVHTNSVAGTDVDDLLLHVLLVDFLDQFKHLLLTSFYNDNRITAVRYTNIQQMTIAQKSEK